MYHPSPARRPTTFGLPILATIGVGVLLGACGRDAPTAPATRAVTVTVSSVGVLADCDEGSGNHGDFTFELVVVDPSVVSASQIRFRASFPGLSGDAVDIDDVAFTMRREAKPGDTFTLEFRVTEWDGTTTADPRMDDELAQAVHAWTSGSDWANGTHVVTVDGGPDCGVNIRYSVSAL